MWYPTQGCTSDKKTHPSVHAVGLSDHLILLYYSILHYFGCVPPKLVGQRVTKATLTYRYRYYEYKHRLFAYCNSSSYSSYVPSFSFHHADSFCARIIWAFGDTRFPCMRSGREKELCTQCLCGKCPKLCVSTRRWDLVVCEAGTKHALKYMSRSHTHTVNTSLGESSVGN